MERITFITHGGKDILLLDFSRLKANEVLQLIDPAKAVISGKPEKSILTLTDVTDLTFNSEVSERMKEFTAHNKPYVRASAIVGVTGLKRIIYNAVIAFSQRQIATFGDREAAKSWLAQQ